MYSYITITCSIFIGVFHRKCVDAIYWSHDNKVEGYEDLHKGYEDLHNSGYTNRWVIHIKGGSEAASQVAQQHKFVYHGQVGSLKDFYHLEHKEVSEHSNTTSHFHHALLSKHPKVLWAEQQSVRNRVRRGYFTDPLYEKQWYLENEKEYLCSAFGLRRGHDINVLPVWKNNITGKGVVVTILDDGVEHTHPDLKENFDFRASYDINSNDNDPFPRPTSNDMNNHGTRCAGEVIASPNNNVCGVGVAFNAKLGGIRMLDGKITDAIEAQSLSFRPTYIDIYSISWGPSDDGRTVDGPGRLALNALKHGINYGRQGKGSIYIWATGNGGNYGDYCSCDGYINSPYTIGIGAVDLCGRKPWYGEECPGTLAVTYGSKAAGTYDAEITTTDLHGRCTTRHTGSSAAAPLAAGIFSLVLEANPQLTWRDLQHLVVQTSKMVSPNDNTWVTNKAGHKISERFGFGALDAGRLVEMANDSNWRTLPPQKICRTYKSFINKRLRRRGATHTLLRTDACSQSKNCVNQLEHVQLVLSLRKASDRGRLEIRLVSPTGTESPILKHRHRDRSFRGFREWEFLTLFHWGENPKGSWKLIITDYSYSGGILVSWYLKFYGTCVPPTRKMKVIATKSKSKSNTIYMTIPLLVMILAVLMLGAKYFPAVISCAYKVTHRSNETEEEETVQL